MFVAGANVFHNTPPVIRMQQGGTWGGGSTPCCNGHLYNSCGNEKGVSPPPLLACHSPKNAGPKWAFASAKASSGEVPTNTHAKRSSGRP